MSAGNGKIVLKVTPWFLWRAVAMLAMFGVFGAWFLYDGLAGYPKKNLVWVMHAAFERAGRVFAEADGSGNLTPAAWAERVAREEVEAPANPALLPPRTPRPLPWPDELKDYGRMKQGKWHDLWLDYSARHRMPAKPAEHLFDEGKIREQLIAGVLSSVAALVVAFFLIRTLRRSVTADETGLQLADGRRVAYAAMRQLDRRKWNSKGLAFLTFEHQGRVARARLDGLTYGGFKDAHGQPAERLMEKLLANFSGELVELEEVRQDSGGGRRKQAADRADGG